MSAADIDRGNLHGQFMDILLAYNPAAGNFTEKLLRDFSAALTARGCVVRQCDSHAPQLPELSAGCQHVCVIGGDGTLRDVIRAHREDPRDIVFSQFPLGTINLVAREAGYRRNIAHMADRIASGLPARTHHIASLNEHDFMACASVGPDAFSVQRVSLRLKRVAGRAAYGVAFLRQLLSWRREALSIRADGEAYAGEAAYVLKGRFFAGPWSLSPTASVSSPTLSLLILPQARRRDFVRLIAAAAISRKLAAPEWITVECTTVSICATRKTGVPQPVQADGDIIAALPVTFAAQPRKVFFA